MAETVCAWALTTGQLVVISRGLFQHEKNRDPAARPLFVRRNLSQRSGGGCARHKFSRVQCAAARAGIFSGLHGSLGGSGHGFLPVRRRAVVEKQSRAAGQIALGFLHRTRRAQLVFIHEILDDAARQSGFAAGAFAPARGRRFFRVGDGHQPDRAAWPPAHRGRFEEN